MWVIGIISILVFYLVYKLSQLILKNDELDDQDMQDAESNEDSDQDEEDSSDDEDSNDEKPDEAGNSSDVAMES